MGKTSPSITYVFGQFMYSNDILILTGESMNPDAMILMVEYRDVDGEERPIIMGFKHGLREVKC